MTQSPPRRTLSSLLGGNAAPAAKAPTLWDELCPRIREGTVIPILGNHLHGDRIFRPLFNRLLAASADAPMPAMNVDEMLAQQWAEKLAYPLHGTVALAQLAQYCRVKSADAVGAQRTYLTFLKETLLDVVATVDPAIAEVVDDLRRQVSERSFSAIADELTLSGDLAPDDDPLRLLARLNLPIYVTTSYYDFLERAIVAEGRTPYTQICGEISNLQRAHRIERDFVPSAEHPVVYHLHGLETYPGSLVLSEDDYLQFLVRVTQPVDAEKPVIPLYLREKLTESTLLLLGYRLQDWDFRATFRGLISVKDEPRRSFSLAIQLDPKDQGDVINPAEAQRYLVDYFRPVSFRVDWGTADEFVRKLWREWKRWQQGDR